MSLLSPRGSTRSWRRLRALVLDRDAHRCQVPLADRPDKLCGALATHVDHILPRSKGGTDALENLRAACRACNLRAGNRQGPVDSRPARRASWSW